MDGNDLRLISPVLILLIVSIVSIFGIFALGYYWGPALIARARLFVESSASNISFTCRGKLYGEHDTVLENQQRSLAFWKSLWLAYQGWLRRRRQSLTEAASTTKDAILRLPSFLLTSSSGAELTLPEVTPPNPEVLTIDETRIPNPRFLNIYWERRETPQLLVSFTDGLKRLYPTWGRRLPRFAEIGENEVSELPPQNPAFLMAKSWLDWMCEIWEAKASATTDRPSEQQHSVHVEHQAPATPSNSISSLDSLSVLDPVHHVSPWVIDAARKAASNRAQSPRKSALKALRLSTTSLITGPSATPKAIRRATLPLPDGSPVIRNELEKMLADYKRFSLPADSSGAPVNWDKDVGAGGYGKKGRTFTRKFYNLSRGIHRIPVVADYVEMGCKTAEEVYDKGNETIFAAPSSHTITDSASDLAPVEGDVTVHSNSGSLCSCKDGQEPQEEDITEAFTERSHTGIEDSDDSATLIGNTFMKLGSRFGFSSVSSVDLADLLKDDSSPPLQYPIVPLPKVKKVNGVPTQLPAPPENPILDTEVTVMPAAPDVIVTLPSNERVQVLEPVAAPVIITTPSKVQEVKPVKPACPHPSSTVKPAGTRPRGRSGSVKAAPIVAKSVVTRSRTDSIRQANEVKPAARHRSGNVKAPMVVVKPIVTRPTKPMAPSSKSNLVSTSSVQASTSARGRARSGSVKVIVKDVRATKPVVTRPRSGTVQSLVAEVRTNKPTVKVLVQKDVKGKGASGKENISVSWR